MQVGGLDEAPVSSAQPQGPSEQPSTLQEALLLPPSRSGTLQRRDADAVLAELLQASDAPEELPVRQDQVAAVQQGAQPGDLPGREAQMVPAATREAAPTAVQRASAPASAVDGSPAAEPATAQRAALKPVPSAALSVPSMLPAASPSWPQPSDDTDALVDDLLAGAGAQPSAGRRPQLPEPGEGADVSTARSLTGAEVQPCAAAEQSLLPQSWEDADPEVNSVLAGAEEQLAASEWTLSAEPVVEGPDAAAHEPLAGAEMQQQASLTQPLEGADEVLDDLLAGEAVPQPVEPQEASQLQPGEGTAEVLDNALGGSEVQRPSQPQQASQQPPVEGADAVLDDLLASSEARQPSQPLQASQLPPVEGADEVLDDLLAGSEQQPKTQPQEMHVKTVAMPEGRSDKDHAEELGSAAAEPASDTCTAVAGDLAGPAAAPDSLQLAAEPAGHSAQPWGSLPHQATADAVISELMQESAADEHATMPSAAAAADFTGPGAARHSQRPAAEFASEAAAPRSSLQLTAESAREGAESADWPPAQLQGLLPHQAAADTLVNELVQDAAAAEQEGDDALEGLQGRAPLQPSQHQQAGGSGHSQPSRDQTLELPEAAPVSAAPLPCTGSAAEQVPSLQHASEGVQGSPAGQPEGSLGVAAAQALLRASAVAAPAAALSTGQPRRVTSTVEAVLGGLVTAVSGCMQCTGALAKLPPCHQHSRQSQSSFEAKAGQQCCHLRCCPTAACTEYILTAAVAQPCMSRWPCKLFPGVLPVPTRSLRRGSHVQVEQAPAPGQPAVSGTPAHETGDVAAAGVDAEASPGPVVHSPAAASKAAVGLEQSEHGPKLSIGAPAMNPAQQILEDPGLSQVDM